MANSEKFTGKAALYAQYRPDYPQQLIDDLIHENHLSPESRVADIGAGTGILTRQLLERGLHLLAIEPNNEMRASAEQTLATYSQVEFFAKPAEATTLPPVSVDLITVAQAFHWFQPEQFKNECRRILKPGARVALIWNSRDSQSPLIQQTEQICRKFCPDFSGFSGGMETIDLRIPAFFQQDAYREETYQHPLHYSLEQFVGRHLSASYAPKPEQPNYTPFIEALKNLFEKFKKKETVSFPNLTKLYFGKVG
ncbi:MAG: class I SAM-dependent methyltransferase [Sporolactobacillus sp.]